MWIKHGYLLKNCPMPKNWFKNSSLDRSLKRGYKHCRCNGNLKRGYCRRCSLWQHANKTLPNKVLPRPPLNQVIVMWSKLLPDHVTLGKYHLTCHVLYHVITQPLQYHVTLGHVTLGHVTLGHVTLGHVTLGHVTLGHVTLGINHMTYQGIGHQHDHMSLHNHLIRHASNVHQVRWLAHGNLWEQSMVYQTINKVTRLWCAALKPTCPLYLYLP